jgi:NADPH:quinone reductase-like Zn-dependent oxidoreductase
MKSSATLVEVVDHLQRDLGIYVPEIPTILGFDAAGIVEKIGRKVTKFNIGDRM